MKFYNLIKQAGLIALCLLFASEAFAYERLSCGSSGKTWPSGHYTINLNPTGFSGQNSHWANSFAVARERLYKGGNFSMSQQIDNDSSSEVGNGESELWWASSGCSATAYTITSSGTCNTIEGDIHFSAAPCVTYESDMSDKTVYRNYGPGIKRTFETTALHEIGHTAGLAHENDEYGMMGSDYTVITSNGNALRSYISQDMNEGLIAMYGNRSNKIKDVSATHWKYQGASGEYSQHERTQLYNSSGAVLPSANHAGCVPRDDGTGPVGFCEQIFTVDQGQVVQAEFLFENVGNDTQTATVGYYLSTTNLITTSDTLLGTQSVTLTISNPAVTTKKSLTIPTNLSPNTPYFIGAIIDYTNALSEHDEQNNASYIPIKTSNSGGSSSGGSSSGGSSSGGSSSGGSSSGGSSSGGNQLQNGVPVSGLSASTGNQVLYSINVPSGASNLVIKIAGGSGDADLYTRAGSAPTDSTYACRPYAGGNSETCTEPSPTSGVWYARVKAYESFSNVTLTASYSTGGSSSGGSSSGGSSSGGSSSGGSSSGGSSSGGNQLQNGVPVSGLSATTGNQVLYTINVPSGASNLVIKIAGGSGDADLYTRAGSAPTDSTYACRPYASGNSETCTEPSPTAGVWYARVKAYSSFSNVTLTASYSGGGSSSGGSSSGGSSSGGSSSGGSSSGGSSSGGGIDNACASESPHSGNGVTAGDTICVPSGSSSSSAQYFWVSVPSNINSMTIKTQYGSGNGNLYYKASTWATASNSDQSSTNSGNTESITVNNPASGYRYISVIGQQSGMALRVDLN